MKHQIPVLRQLFFIHINSLYRIGGSCPFSTIGPIDMAVSMGPHGSFVFVVVDDDGDDDDEDGGDDGDGD